MAITVTSTVGGASSNSYQSVAEVLARAELLPGYAEWGAISSEDQKWCAVYATTLLDRLPWLGSKVTTTQALALPRYNLPQKDANCSSWGRNTPYATTAIPEPVLAAHALIAVGLAVMGGRSSALIPNARNDEFTSLKIGDISMTMGGNSAATKVDALSFPGVYELLEGLFS